jgi:hypothetical protein
MDPEQAKTMGWYEPSYLHIRVSTSRKVFNLDTLLKSVDPEDTRVLSTFFHEYIHFLQEVTTASGVYRLGLMIDFIKGANYEIRQDGKPSFKVPFKFSNTFNAIANKKLLEIYTGNGDAEYAYYDYYSVNEIEVADRTGFKRKVPSYTVFYRSQRAELKKFTFGHLCLKEFVTHTLQQRFFPLIDHADVPYKIAGQIIEKECPSFGGDEMHQVALCDACLMDIHPARCFFNTIEKIKKTEFTPNSCQEVYDFVYKDLLFWDGEKALTARQCYEQGGDFTKNQVADALKSVIFFPNKKWIKYIFQQAEDIRFKKPTFMTELVDGPGRFSELFFKLFRRLGTPFYTDENFNGGFVPPVSKSFKGVQPYQLLIFREILNVYNGHKKCGLYEFCKKRPDKDITNANCQTAPWLQGQEDELCPFGQLWKTWGLNGKTPDHNIVL